MEKINKPLGDGFGAKFRRTNDPTGNIDVTLFTKIVVSFARSIISYPITVSIELRILEVESKFVEDHTKCNQPMLSN